MRIEYLFEECIREKVTPEEWRLIEKHFILNISSYTHDDRLIFVFAFVKKGWFKREEGLNIQIKAEWVNTTLLIEDEWRVAGTGDYSTSFQSFYDAWSYICKHE